MKITLNSIKGLVLVWYFNLLRALSIILKLDTEEIGGNRSRSRRDIKVFFIEYAYAWGVIPFHYNAKMDEFVLHETKSNLLCWVSVMSLFLIAILLLTLVLAEYEPERESVN